MNDTLMKSKITPNVGYSLQRLIDLPGENLLRPRRQQKSSDLSSKSRPFSILRRKSQIISDKIKETASYSIDSSSSSSTTTEPVSLSLRLIIQHYLTKQSILKLLDLLAKDVEKERRTKRGLTNLVQVYAHQPVYTDKDTLIEARRRLYFSRVRLSYLTQCRQKLAYSLKQIHLLEDGNSNSLLSSCIELPSCLIQTGFSKLLCHLHTSSELNKTSVIDDNDNSNKFCLITGRAVYLPDLDEIPNNGVNVIEWPPFPIEDIGHEDVNDDIFQWDIEKIRQHLLEQNSFWILENEELKSDGYHHYQSLDTKLSCPQLKSVSQRNCSNTMKSILLINDKKTSKNAYLDVKKSVGIKDNQHITTNNNVIESLNTCQYSSLNQSSRQVLFEERKQDLSISKVKGTEFCSTTTTTTTTTTANIMSKSSVHSSMKTVEKTPTLAVNEIDTHDSIVTSCSPTISTSSSSSPVSQTLEKDISTNIFRSRFGYGIHGSFNKVKFNHNHQSTDCNKNHNNNRNFNNTNRKSIVKSDILGVNKSKMYLNSLNISSSSSSNTNPMDNQSLSPCKSVHFSSEVNQLKDSNQLIKDNLNSSYNDDDDDEYLSSSLHCLGWAKVQRNYTPRHSSEIHLQEGDIISIYRKDSSDWWYGEVNGSKGRFPVSYVEEF
ncbi:unnamed protein product [Heterobilharzia americana]|nr:unnamed protein product [Heterobilharzia americana]